MELEIPANSEEEAPRLIGSAGVPLTAVPRHIGLAGIPSTAGLIRTIAYSHLRVRKLCAH